MGRGPRNDHRDKASPPFTNIMTVDAPKGDSTPFIPGKREFFVKASLRQRGRDAHPDTFLLVTLDF